MNDLKRMDIEGIERHWHNYKLFTWFLKKEKRYEIFRNAMFTKQNRTPLELFKIMNSTNSRKVLPQYLTNNFVDKMWGCIFTYTPFLGFSWYANYYGILPHQMRDITKKWVVFLSEHNYDKFRF